MSYQEHLTAGLANIWDCTTSEAAERIAPKRKRISQDSLREEIPWTAARCNRLLRTITSRVNILRKQSKLCATGSSVRDAQSSRSVTRILSEDASPPRKDCKPSANDPEWVPGAETKTTSRTYSGKPRQKSASQKADSGFSTPFVKRLLKNDPLSAAKPRLSATRADERPRKALQLPVQLASRNEEAQRNLVRAFDNLLVATGSASGEKRIGARSLMSACLRRVSDYIDLELEDLDDTEENDEDITSSIYSELESLGTNSGGGWSGLREVVRSHGLHHVLAAIDGGLISDTRISELVGTCSKHCALAEADSLLRAWIARDCSTESGRVKDTHTALAKLAELRSTYDAPELYLRHHANLVQSGSVYLGDVLRPGSAPLKDMISGLLRGPGQDTALAFLESTVSDDYAASSTASLPVVSRLAGLLASLALAQAGSNTRSSDTDLDLFAVVTRVAALIAQMDESTRINHSTSVTTKHNAKSHPFTMASALLQLTTQTALPDIATTPLNALIKAIAAYQNAFVKFAVNVAQHVHRFSDADELESLFITISGLLAPPPECNDENRSTLNRLAFEIAFAYREQTGIDIDDRLNARLVAASSGGPGSSIAQTPRRRPQVSGYKWEEGLCEWIAATPMAKPLFKNPQTLTNTPRQFLTPNKESTSPPVLPPSPLVLIPIQSPPPPHTDATSTPQTLSARPALRERSTNHQPPNKPLQSPQKTSKPSRASFLKPTLLPKQVHLKEERAKKAAAALLAQQAQTQAQAQSASSQAQAPYPPKNEERLKRSLSLANIGSSSSAQNEEARRSVVVSVDTDELGILTPARTKVKRGLKGRSFGGRLSLSSSSSSSSSSFGASRASLSVRMLDGMSEDELGL
jgi:hypothetical protein